MTTSLQDFWLLKWAEAQLGKSMRSQMGGFTIEATSYELGKNGHGAWFFDSRNPARRVYRRASFAQKDRA